MTLKITWLPCVVVLAACGGLHARGGESVTADAGIAVDAGEMDADSVVVDAGEPDAGWTDDDAGVVVESDAGTETDAGVADAGPAVCNGGGAAGVCYANACAQAPATLQANRDRLVADLATRKCTDSCTLWAALSQAERYIFLMDTAYFASSSSLLYPPGTGNQETALDHAVALYSINAPKAGQGVDLSGRGGGDYNRSYLGFDDFGKCVMRHFGDANPGATANANGWVHSDDIAGAHAPFTQREMIFWYKAVYDPNSNGPQWHHWAADGDFTQSGIDARLGVCGNTDRSLTESTVAFDFFHNSDPLGDYSGRGGFGWQIVDQHINIAAQWDYMPTGCPVTPPVNTDQFGGGTYAGMGPVQSSGGCTLPLLGTCPTP